MKIEIESNVNGVTFTAVEKGRILAAGTGPKSRDAARWLVHHMNRLCSDVEDTLIDMGLVSEEECNDIATGSLVKDKEQP